MRSRASFADKVGSESKSLVVRKRNADPEPRVLSLPRKGIKASVESDNDMYTNTIAIDILIVRERKASYFGSFVGVDPTTGVRCEEQCDTMKIVYCGTID